MNSLENEHKIIKKAFKKIESIGWQKFNLQIFSKDEKIPMEKITSFFSSKTVLLKKFSKMIDYNVELNFSTQDMSVSSIKDNLFELIMLRFEQMQDYKNSLRIIIKNSRDKPILLTRISKNILNTLDLYLEISNGYDKSVLDIFKKNILFLIYSYCFNVWLNDSSEDLTKTMAELDRLLSMAEKFSKRFKEILPI
tara:strand:+ start:68 stop:652 length:585 start_codon:yes stop_codon:yes gene_type:complete